MPCRVRSVCSKPARGSEARAWSWFRRWPHGVTHLFTDVSPFFLNNARERFRDVPWVSYALFDINRDYRDQRLLPNSFDAIVCANVLHYARDAAAVLGRLRELLRPGGWLIFIDMVRDNYQVLTSMEFLFDATAGDFEDVRAGRDETFISLQQWRQLLADAGAEIGLCVPAPGDVLAEIGFHVFAARFKQERTPLHSLELGHLLTKRLPEYMIPLHLQIVDAMPVTDNGKVDRATLRTWIPADVASPLTTGDDDPASDLERRLADVWQSVLRVEHVGRHQDFFQLGGDSLLASQLVGRMREEVREAGTVFFDALLRTVLDGPTVAKLAAQLEHGAAGGGAQMPADVRFSPLVHLKTSTEGPLRVLLHDASGTLASYAALLDDLAASGSLAGLVVNDATYVGTQTAVLVRRFAAVYARALETTSGPPLHLIGCDVGGIMAVEVARYLLEAGRTNVSLTVINSLPVPYIVDDELFTEYLFARGAGVDPVRLGYPAEGPLVRAIDGILDEHADRIPLGALEAVSGDAELDGVGWCFRRLGARRSEDRLAAVARLVNQTSSSPAPPGQIRALYDVFRHSLRAFALHDIGPYAGNMTLVRSNGGAPLWLAATHDVAEFLAARLPRRAARGRCSRRRIRRSAPADVGARAASDRRRRRSRVSMTPPLVGVLGATGAVGREVTRLLTASGRTRIRLGGRRREPLETVAADAGRTEVMTVDLDDRRALAGFCDGCRIVLNCAGPSFRILDLVARAAFAAGSDYVDPGGDHPLYERLTHDPPPSGRTAIVTAGMMPGLSGLLPRWLARQGFDTTRRLTAYVGGRGRLTWGTAADYVLSAGAAADGALAAWRHGASAPRALEPLVDVEVPFFPGRVTARPFLSEETETLARELGLADVAWYNVFQGAHMLAVLRRLTPGRTSQDLAMPVEELCRAAELDLFGETTYQLLVFVLEGEAVGTTVRRTLLVRAVDAQALTGTVTTLAAMAILDGEVEPGVCFAARGLPLSVVERLRDAPAVTGFDVFNDAGTSPGTDDGML